MDESKDLIAWIIPLALIALAAFVLFLRDRYRDFKRVPQSVRRAEERSTELGARIFMHLFFAVVALVWSIDSSTFDERGLFLAISGLFFWFAWRNWISSRRAKANVAKIENGKEQ